MSSSALKPEDTKILHSESLDGSAYYQVGPNTTTQQHVDLYKIFMSDYRGDILHAKRLSSDQCWPKPKTRSRALPLREIKRDNAERSVITKNGGRYFR